MANKKQKTIALIFILLMFGSTFTYAILNAFGGKEEETQIPQERIITYELNKKQRSYLLPRGFTLIEYSYPTGCLDCMSVKNYLEQITQNSDGQIFLQEITTSGSAKITMTSLNGEKTINNPTKEEVETIICNFLISKPLWCITSKV